MSEPQWTPGPWRYHEQADDEPRRSYEVWQGDRRICQQIGDEADPANSANAHLLAAAPDLYEALYSLIERLATAPDAGAYLRNQDVIDRGGEALAMARGEREGKGG